MKHKSTVYLKFIVAYLLFAVLSLLVIDTFTSKMTQNARIRSKAAELYKEAATISNTYSKNLSNKNFSGTDFREQLGNMDLVTSTTIWKVLIS